MDSKKSHVCPIDKRRFATKAALRQHRTTSHDCAPQGRPMVARARGRGRGAFRAQRTPREQSTRARTITGADMVAVSANLSTSTVVGSVIAEFDVTPSFFDGTRLAAEAQLWSRWKPQHLMLQVIPSAGSLVTGTYCVGFTYEVNAVLGTGIGAVKQINSYIPSSTATVYNKISFNIPVDTAQKWLHTSGRERADMVHGKVFAVLTSPIGNITNDSKINFTFRMVWTVAFEGPVLPGTAETGASVYVDDGYESYHTTSTADWASGGRLSLKHVAGGALCPFSTARSDIVYKLDPVAKLYYVKEDKTKALVTHAVIIKSFAGKHFAVFASKETAQKYLQSGSVDDCLPYVEAGDVVTPANPAWIPETTTVSKPDPAFLIERLLDLEARLQRALQLSDNASVASESSFQMLPS